jgi:hypothetical protein
VFDLRYHVASLAAVFIALIIGILVGVGLSGSGVTKEADLKRVQLERDNARADAQRYQLQRDQLRKASTAFSLAYPAVMRGLLAGKRIAVLYVGPADGRVSGAVDTTLADAGARPAVRTLSLKVPLDVDALDQALAAKGPQFSRFADPAELPALASALTAEFVTGGDTPLWDGLGRQLVVERGGNTRVRVDGVVVARSVKPQQGDTARFLRGLYTELASSGIPVVGIELTGSNPSAIPTFTERGLSSVDDVDRDTGRSALALLLAGARSGHYGVRDDAEAIIPRSE